MPHVPSHDRSFATVGSSSHQSLGIDRCNYIQIAGKFRLTGHVAFAAIGIPSHDCQLLGLPTAENSILYHHG